MEFHLISCMLLEMFFIILTLKQSDSSLLFAICVVQGARVHSQQVVSLCCSFLLPSHLSLLLWYGLFMTAEPLRTAISSECTNQVPCRSASTRRKVSITSLSWADSKCNIRIEMVWSSRDQLACAWQRHGHGCSAPASLLSVVLYFLLMHT